MARFGFVGSSYTSQSVIADCQTCMNFYVENMEDPASRAARVLYPTPGLIKLGTFPGGASRAQGSITEGTERFFSVNGGFLYEGFVDGSYNQLGAVVNDGLPARIGVGQTHLTVASGGHAYYYNLTTGAFGEINTTSGAALQGRVLHTDFSDGYFIFVLKNSSKWQISALEDATSWNPLDIAQISVFAGDIVSFMVDHGELCFAGTNWAVSYYNSGNPFFPFDVIPSSKNHYGSGASFGMNAIDNNIFLVSKSKDGGNQAFKINGYRFERISTHAVENAWASYSTTSDAWGFTYQDQGHPFWVVNFPTANKTWVFDVATNLWHERGYWNGAGYDLHLAATHAFVFGVHLVGDRRNGNVYKMSIAIGDDNGQPIRRLRRAPHISRENKRTTFSQLEILCEVGLGPQPPLLDGNDQPRGPQMTLRMSRDGGKTWPLERILDMGQAGETKKRVFTTRLGQARDAVFEISYSDYAPCRIIDAFLEADPGFSPTARLSEEIRKSA